MKNVKLLFLLLFAVNVWSHSANIANPPALKKNKAEVSVSTNTITILGKQGEKFPVGLIEGYLNQGKNVVFKADGNIVFNETIAKQTGATTASLTISSTSNGSITFGKNALIASKAGKLDVLVQTKGSINMATSAVIASNGGSIRLQAIEETGRLKRTAVSKIALMGTVNASSNAKGGKIFIESDAIQLHPSARVFAKGKRGGGTILIGGDWQGGAIAEKRETESIQQAISVKMDQGAVVDASATENGDGGKVVLWSNLQHPSSSTAAHGTLAAKGAGTSSKGGKIETSGGALQFENIDVSTIASDGTAGEWLLDPYNFYFNQTQLDNLAANLANNDITISTDNSSATGGPNSVYGSGHIVFQNNFNYTSSNNRTLRLNAKGDIVINGHIKSTGGALNLDLNSQNSKRILIDYDIETNGGYINFSNSPTVHFQKTSDTQSVNTAGGLLQLGSSNVKLLRNNGNVVFNTGNGGLSTGTGTIEQINTRYAISGAVTKYNGWGGAHTNGSKTYGVNVVAGREYSTRLYFWDSWDANEQGQLFVRKPGGAIDYYFQGERPSGGGFTLAQASNGAQFTASGVSNIGRTSNFNDQYVDVTFVAANNGVFETWTNLDQGVDDESLEIYNIFETEFTESNYTLGSRSLELITTSGQIFGSRNFNGLGSLTVNTGNDSSVLDGAISGTTTFTKNGSGTVYLRGALSYSGTSTVNAGSLVIQNNAPNPTNKAFTGSGSLRIEPASTSFSSAFSTSGWSFGTGLSGLTIGKSGNTANITSGTATTIAGPINVYGGNIGINESLNTTAAGTNGDILLKASGDISLTASKTITTSGGDVILWADADGNNDGMVNLNTSSSIATSGGHLWIGGGSGTSTYNGLTVGNGFATGNATISNGVTMTTSTLNTSGGNIAIYGKSRLGVAAGSSNTNGIRLLSGNTINSGTGTIYLKGYAQGTSGSSNGIELSETSFSDLITSANTSANAIYLEGETAAVPANVNDGWGIYTWLGTIQATANGGGITMIGKGTKNNGVTIPSGSSVLAKTGTITITGTGYGSGAYAVQVAGILGQKAGSSVTTSSSDITITGNTITGSGSLATNGKVSIQPYDASFSSAFSTSGWSFGTGISGLTLGKSGNTASITSGTATTIAGPISIFGGAIAVNTALTAANNTIDLIGSGAITQTAAITANALALNGTGSVTLNNTSNAINTIAAGTAGARIGAINFVNNKALAIGTVTNSGVYSSGLVELATTSGDISVTQPINSSLASGDAVKLFANKGAAAGTAGNGNVKFSGSGSITIEPNARALLYSGSEETSLSTAIGGAANYRYNVADTTPLGNIIPAIGTTGKFGLLRAKDKTDLATLTLSQGTLSPAFAATTTSYTATVGHAITSMTITPTVSDANATVKVNGNPVTSGTASGAITLNVGANIITTIVTGQDGVSTKTYTVTVTRTGSPDANLTALAVSQGTISPAFATGTTTYTASVDNAVTSLTITPTLSEANATVKVNTVPVSSGSASGAINLNVGANIITTIVTAQDSNTTKTYTVTITRAASANADLSALALSSGAISPIFATGTLAYSTNVANDITSITVTPTRADATASITVNGNSVTSGSASGAIALTTGINTITTTVTAQDGTTKTYTVTVTRALSSNADLAALTLSQGTLSPSFVAPTTSYTANVSNATTSITVTPTRADATASITVNGTTVTSGSASSAIALNLGNNTITTTITAQDGTIKTYTVTVNRAQSANANLAALSISSVNFAPSFAAATTTYNATVSTTVASVTVTPTKADPDATITVNGIPVNSAATSDAITLNLGSNTITTVVTAQNGATKTYTVTITKYPVPGNALAFDGTNDRVYASSPFPGTNMTLEAWIKTSASNSTQEIINLATASSNKLLEFRLNNNKLAVGTNGNTASSWTEIVGTTLLNTGKWTHVAVVKTGINYVLYVNGVADATGTINVTDAVTDIINIGAAYWDNTLRSSYTFNGSIDEVRVWNVAKTQAQIQAAMYSELNTSALPANLSNYYQFSADSGLTLLDLSGNNRNATLQNFSLSGTNSNWVESYAMVVPQVLTNTAVQSTSFTANWNAPTVGTVDNYVLEVATNANFSTLVAGYSNKNVGNVTSFEVTGLEQNKIHYWRVRANKATVTNQSAYQSQTVTTTKDPINVTSTTATNTFDLLTNSAKIVDPNIAVVSSQLVPGFKVSISSGKQDGDVLSYTGSLPSGVTATAYDAATGVLTFNGTTTTANWQALLRTVTFRGYKNGTGARGISFSAGTLNSFSNGHFYEYIPAASTSWTAAKALAADKTYLNYTGYLATVTSQAENDYIKQILSSDAWMGASDDYIHINAATGTTTFANQSAAEGKWHWVTGPEAGTQFMTSNGGTNVVAGKFANWANNEPNNYQGSEHYGQFYSSNNALWNDLPNTYSTIQGYLIEYGGLASDIVQTPSYSVTMNVTSEEPGNAMNFDGANDYVYASGLITNPTTFTLEAWFKTTTANGPIVGLNSTTANEFGNFDRFIWLNDGKVKFGVYNGASNTLSTTTNYNDGKYHHVAATFTTGTGAGMKLYVDGVLIASNTLNSVNAYDGYWKIGGFTNWTNGANAIDYFNGSIDEVKIWNTVRTLAEIQADLKNPAVLGTAGLTHYYSFNQGLAAASNAGLTTLYDQTAANRNAVVNNASLSGASSNWVSSYAMVIPTTIAATSTYSLGFTANWTAPSKGIATNYFLDVATDANFTALVSGYSNRAVGNVLTFDVSGLLPSTNYYYRVRAANATESNGVSSNVTSVTTNTKETLVATAATNNSSVSFTANWTAPAIHTIAAYLLDVATDANFTTFVSGYNGLSVTGLTKVVSGLTANTTYYYRVRVANYNNSNTITTNTKAPFAAIASNVNAVCINGTQPIITFTGSGSTVLPYTFTYSINGITQPTLVTSGSAETASIAVPTTTSGTKTYALISVKDGSGGSNLQSGNAVIAINALPVPTILAAPATAVCTTTEVQYATQADQTDYFWTIAGVAGTDYQITTGSASTAAVTVKWLTAGNKNVSVRYTNSSGCMAIVPTVVTTTVTATPIVAAITGVTTTTAGLTRTLENATANGVWSSSNNAIAFINTTGTVTAIGEGTATITYTVTNGNCSTSVTTPFTVNVAPIPTLITISPLSGVVGSTVTVMGTNFSGTSIVTLGGVEVAFTVINNTTISVIVPSGTTGGVIVVTTPGGTATSETFNVLSQALPTITSFTPTSAGAGQTVTITGTNLLNASEVTFGNTAVATYTVVSNTSITAQIGIGATGSVSVTTPGGIATKEGFTFINCTNPSVYAGDSVALCTSDTLINIGQSATAADYTTLVWTTSGTGTFANNTTATALTTATYTLSAADKASGSVTLTLTATAVAGCTNAVSSKTLTISPASVAGTIAITTSIATGTNSATVSLTGSIGAVQWQSGTDGIAFTNINSATSATYVASNITATTYYRAVVSNGVCSPVTSAMVLVTVPTAPTANAQALCAGSTINNLVATGTNLKWYAAATGGTAQATTTALATGTYYVSQTVGAVESARTSVLVSIENTTWNGTAWSNGLPTATKGVIISGNFTAEATITACSLTVNNGAIVVIKSGVNLEIANQVDVAVGASLTFENNANLIQINDVANTGNAIVKRDSNPLYRLDYTLWSAPVTNANAYLAPFSPLTSNAGTSIRFYTYDAASSLYTSVLSAASTPFSLGKGYLIRMPNEDPAIRGTTSPYFKGTTPIVFKGQFTGVLNNGTINLSGFTPSSYNAIGNPYPSAINADTFIKSNAGTGTLYFWRNKNSDSGSSYATYTLAGAVANGGYTPNGSIAVGQGFITKAPSSGTITFTNAMRASTASTPATFLRTKGKTTAKKDKIWLNLSKGNSQVNQILLAYMDGATTGVDADIDGKYINDSPNALTWDINNEEYVIQGRPEFTDTDLVPLIFKTNVAGDYTIAKDKVEGVFAIGQAVYLVDTVTGTQTNLQTTAYNFTTAVGTFNSRFKLVYRTDNSLGVNELIQDQNNIVVYKQNAVLNIDAGSTIIKYVKVFDLGGRLLLEQKAVNATTSVIENLVGVHQVLMIQITTDDNKTITKKVIY